MYETYYDILQPYFGQKNFQCQYMDSVTKDTPIIIRENENIKILRIDESADNEDWYVDNNVVTSWGYKEFVDCNNIQIWTSLGWRNIRKLVRQKTEKDIYRIRTKHEIVDVTEDHSLINKNREIIKPCDLEIGEEFLHNYIDFGEPQITFDDIIDKIYNIEPQRLREKEMFVRGFFMGDGSSGICKYKSGKKCCWHLNNLDFSLIEKLQRICKEIWNDIDFKIYDIRETSNTYRISSSRIKLALEFEKIFTKEKEKRIPCNILNETVESKKWFLTRFYSANGNRKNKQKNISFSQKHKITMSGLNYLCQCLWLKTCISKRGDKYNIFQMVTVINRSDENFTKLEILGK